MYAERGTSLWPWVLFQKLAGHAKKAQLHCGDCDFTNSVPFDTKI